MRTRLVNILPATIPDHFMMMREWIRQLEYEIRYESLKKKNQDKIMKTRIVNCLTVTIPDNFMTKAIVDKTTDQHHWIIVWYVTVLGDKVIV